MNKLVSKVKIICYYITETIHNCMDKTMKTLEKYTNGVMISFGYANRISNKVNKIKGEIKKVEKLCSKCEIN